MSGSVCHYGMRSHQQSRWHCNCAAAVIAFGPWFMAVSYRPVPRPGETDQSDSLHEISRVSMVVYTLLTVAVFRGPEGEYATCISINGIVHVCSTWTLEHFLATDEHGTVMKHQI